MPLGRRLSELARNDPHPHQTVVLHLGIAEADDLPTIAPQARIMGAAPACFCGCNWQENKERYYQYPLLSGRQREAVGPVDEARRFCFDDRSVRLGASYGPAKFGL